MIGEAKAALALMQLAGKAISGNGTAAATKGQATDPSADAGGFAATLEQARQRPDKAAAPRPSSPGRQESGGQTAGPDARAPASGTDQSTVAAATGPDDSIQGGAAVRGRASSGSAKEDADSDDAGATDPTSDTATVVDAGATALLGWVNPAAMAAMALVNAAAAATQGSSGTTDSPAAQPGPNAGAGDGGIASAATATAGPGAGNPTSTLDRTMRATSPASPPPQDDLAGQVAGNVAAGATGSNGQAGRTPPDGSAPPVNIANGDAGAAAPSTAPAASSPATADAAQTTAVATAVAMAMKAARDPATQPASADAVATPPASTPTATTGRAARLQDATQDTSSNADTPGTSASVPSAAVPTGDARAAGSDQATDDGGDPGRELGSRPAAQATPGSRSPRGPGSDAAAAATSNDSVHGAARARDGGHGDSTGGVAPGSALAATADTSQPVRSATKTDSDALQALAQLGSPGIAAAGHASTLSTGTLQTSVPVPVTDPQFQEALASQVGMLVSHDVQRADIVVTPPHMGPIRIELAMDGNDVNVAFTAAHPDTRHAIEQTADVLRSMLSERGVSLGQMNVGHGSPQQQAFGGFLGQQPGQGSNPGSSGPARSASTGAASPVSAAAVNGTGSLPTAGSRSATAGLVDLFA